MNLLLTAQDLILDYHISTSILTPHQKDAFEMKDLLKIE